MNMNDLKKVAPEQHKTHRSLNKIVCFACCFGSYTEYIIKKNNNNNNVEDGDHTNCCWLLGFCQTKTFQANTNDIINSESKTSYFGCCFCWDYEGSAYCCCYPLNK